MTYGSRNDDMWASAPPPPPPYGGWRPADPYHLGAPSAWPTLLVSVFFGPLGLIPALIHSREARERGYDSRKYWMAFFLPVVVAIVVFAVVVLIVLASVHSTSVIDRIQGNSGISVSPGGGAAYPAYGVPTTLGFGAAPLP